MRKIKSIAVLCSGGDAPGMNAAIRAIVRYGIHHGLQVYGILKGYSGLLEGQIEPMNLRSVANIIQRGGTIIKTDRCFAFYQKTARREATHILRRKDIDALIVIGGDGTFTGAYLMGKENQFPIVGVPATIDNDVYGSEYTIGFDTAVNTALDAIDKIRDTASSHDRVFLVEVMGHTSSEIATRVGLSGGAETIIIPQQIQRSNGILISTEVEKLVHSLKESVDHGKMSSIVVVAEGPKVGLTYKLSREIKKRGGIDSRVAILGHVQRGGIPSALDRYMASLMGVAAVSAVLEGKSALTIGMNHSEIISIPFKHTIGKHKKPDLRLLRLAHILAA